MTKTETGIVAKKVYLVGGQQFDDYVEARKHAAELRQKSLHDNLVNLIADSPFADEAGAIDLARLILTHFDVKLKGKS